MKKISAGMLMAILTVGLPLASQGARGQDAAAELKTLDAKLTEAFMERNVKMLGKHMADDYMMIDPRGGTHSKTKYLKHLAEGTGKVKEMKETDVQVKVSGDAGFVTGLLHVKGKVEDKEIGIEYRWTRVYYKKGGEWLCILEQHTHVHPKAAKKKPD
jgi:ketosteroid isomerase-like protein